MILFLDDVNYLDIILLVPIAWGAFIGFKKGLIIEVATLLGIALGIFGAIEGSDMIAGWISGWVDWSPRLIRIVSFLVTFIAIVIIVQLIARGLEKLIKLAALGMVNRISGSVFGMMKYTLILMLITYLIDRMDRRYPFLGEDARKQSLLFEPFSQVIPTVYPGIREFVESDQD